MQENWRTLGEESSEAGFRKIKGKRKGGERLHCVGRALNCQARVSAVDLSLDEGEPLRVLEQPSVPVSTETDSKNTLLGRTVWSLRLVQKADTV